ncbi:MAG: zinc ribbon domain-containing protein [Chloroflexota bacterium]
MASDVPEELIRCKQCGNNVPRLTFCIRCGDPLSDEYQADAVRSQRRRFVAAPDERVSSPAFVSTFFPQLPSADMRSFRRASAAGLVIIVGLALAGLFPVAIVSAALLVPLLMVLYLYDVDVYEDEPISVIGATMLWGAVAGVAYGLLLRNQSGVGGSTGFGGSFGGGPNISEILLNGVGLPIVELALMLAGPLLLLRWRRFNDVLDGATFGAASAVSFGGAHLLVQSVSMFGAGLRPPGDALPWVIQIVSLGVLQPVIAAGAVGAVGAAFWLRFRAPVADHHKLGPVGNPVLALAGAIVLVVVAGLAGSLLTLIPTTVVLAMVALVALLWLRRALHLGLLQELREVTEARSITCPNCGRETPEHDFCGQCGIALRALPRPRRAQSDTQPEARPDPHS